MVSKPILIRDAEDGDSAGVIDLVARVFSVGAGRRQVEAVTNRRQRQALLLGRLGRRKVVVAQSFLAILPLVAVGSRPTFGTRNYALVGKAGLAAAATSVATDVTGRATTPIDAQPTGTVRIVEATGKRRP